MPERVFGDLRIEPAARRVTIAGEEVTLTKTEFDLLEAITSRPKIVHTREMLREASGGPTGSATIMWSMSTSATCARRSTSPAAPAGSRRWGVASGWPAADGKTRPIQLICRPAEPA